MMQALRRFPKSQKLQLVSEDIPQPIKSNDVIVKVAYAGVCGTDLKIIKGEYPTSESPLILGHEISGTVYAIGSAVKHVSVGTRVGLDPNRACRQCHYCQRGQPHLCNKEGLLRDAIGHYRDGGWAEFCRAPAEQVYPLPSGLSLKQGVLCEPLSCILHGWELLGTVHSDANILIIGMGIIGNLWACLFHHYGYRNVIVSEIAEGRRKLAENNGTGFQVLSPSDLEEKFSGTKDLDEEGLDLIVDCSGEVLAVEQSVAWLRRGATVLIFGVAPPTNTLRLSAWDIFKKEITVKGSYINPFTYRKSINVAAAMADKYLDYQKLGVEIFSLMDYERAFTTLGSRKISKAVFLMSE